ncbi:unnamed protein product [Colias eurytheme]|nr:unnamed protein product [Colias eurytheme]
MQQKSVSYHQYCVSVILIPKSLQQISDKDEQRSVIIDSNENVDASRTDNIETVTPYPIYLEDDGILHEKAFLRGNKHESSVRKNRPYIIYPNFSDAGYYNDGRQLLRRRAKKRGMFRPKPYPKPTKPTRPKPRLELDRDYDEDTELLNALIKLNGQFIFRSS